MRKRRFRIAAVAVGVVVLVVFLASFLIDELLRRRVESGVNAQLVGYTARIGRLRFHPIGGSIDLLDATLTQNANPDPPVASIPCLHASLHWRALLHLRLVADFRFDRPVLNVDLRQAKQEKQDKVPLHQRGWQAAAEEIYPFKIDVLRISDGDFTYTDRGPYKPLHVSQINLHAENIRNVRSRERQYPSEVQLTAIVFDQAPLRIEGHADFLAEPHAGIHTYATLHGIPLAYFTPLLERYGSIRKGMLSFDGDIEYAPRIKSLNLDELVIEDVDADYIRTAENAAEEKQATQKAV